MTKTDLTKRVEALEQEIASIKSSTHEHTISPETILHIADIVKADIAASLLPAVQPATVEEEVQA